MKQKELLHQIDETSLVAAIGRAEGQCSGEIRVHIESRLGKHDLRDFAERTFERLGMTKTAQRNGVLLFIAAEEQRFVILGDRGIDERVGPGYWDNIATRLSERFKRDEFTAGIVEAIERVGEQLQTCFPRRKDDVDELGNQISRDETGA